ncbi:DUF485 domain-containing protein [Paraburkholderia caribensis]|uniref:DUF485 domain-containing protein n=1 Tax=Paraburkholderia TaxID=1822464 RepID=UPI001CB199B0|nr:DUF485 domain-containing protein [Paraburkholderia caribensis]BEU25578.1 DUF485 domain-containing protein [Paraburkholderia sp. 22B1P]CAG9262616.1 conserved hypothetical protein [Paraburkholderia caribensis]
MIELSGQALPSTDSTLAPSDGRAMLPPSKVVLHSAAFNQLKTKKLRIIGPILGLSLAFIFGVALMAGYAPALMSVKVDGAFNVGYVLVVAIYAVCWITSVVYVRIANRSFEALGAEVRKTLEGDGQ